MNWIPVNEKKPEFNVAVLVCNINEDPDNNVTVAVRGDNDDFWLMEANIFSDRITHWMELPKPPHA